jgi:hypothetical protein
MGVTEKRRIFVLTGNRTWAMQPVASYLVTSSGLATGYSVACFATLSASAVKTVKWWGQGRVTNGNALESNRTWCNLCTVPDCAWRDQENPQRNLNSQPK